MQGIAWGVRGNAVSRVWQGQVRACRGWGGLEPWPRPTCREHQSQVLSRDWESHLHSQSHEYAQNLLNYAERKDVNVYANLVLPSLLLWKPKKSKGGPNPGESGLERLEERRLAPVLRLSLFPFLLF